jgi:hypothetical protein
VCGELNPHRGGKRGQTFDLGVDTSVSMRKSLDMPRIEYCGAVYHVLNRGNYRQYLFTVPEFYQWLLKQHNE